MRLPTNNRVTLAYGDTSLPYSPSNPHGGVDFSRWPNQRVYSPEKARVTNVTYGSACGNQVDIIGQQNRKYRFCHLHSVDVRVGQEINEGDVIGLIGNTGFSFGAHLHFVMWVGGTRVDPYKTIQAIMEEEDMYKGKTSKEWHDLYQTTLKERNIFKKMLIDIRDMIVGLIGNK